MTRLNGKVAIGGADGAAVALAAPIERAFADWAAAALPRRSASDTAPAQSQGTIRCDLPNAQTTKCAK
jgi:hypothetical protein